MGTDEGARVIDARRRIEHHYERKERMMAGKKLPSIEISEPIPLKEYDETGETWVQFQRPRRWEREQLSRLRAQAVLEFDTAERGTVRQRDIVPETVVDSERVAVCLVDANILDEEGKGPVFVPGKTCRQAKKRFPINIKDNFYEAWEQLPDDLCEEIIAALLEFHPPFDWRNVERQGE